MIATLRSYQLPWEAVAEQDALFRRLLKQLLIAALAFSIVIPLLPVPESEPVRAEDVPPRFARLLLEKPVPPPPPVVQPPQPEPVQTRPETPTTVPRPQPVQPVARPTARETATRSGLLPFADQLAELRDSSLLNNVQSAAQLANASGEAAQVERAVISASASRHSGGVNTASLSRDTGGAGLQGRDTTRVSSTVGAGAPAAASGSGKVAGAATRSREEIELEFDRNKGAIFALYNRALRSNPMLQGKLVLQLTIAPSGEVTDCQVISSELNDPDMERRLVQRVKMFRFEARDVATVTTTKPIDFFPA